MDSDAYLSLKPSQLNVHLKYYEKGARERALDLPGGATVADLIKETAINKYRMHPALIYNINGFVTAVSRRKFAENIDTYAKALDAIGVKEGECVPMYGPFVPEMGYILLALIQLGAWANILPLEIPKADIGLLTRKSKVAVVFDGIGLYGQIKEAVERDRFKYVIVVSAFDSFGLPLCGIMNINMYRWAKKLDAVIPGGKKFIRRGDILRLAKNYGKAPKAAPNADRIAVGTGSSGSAGTVKCVVATNRSIISNVRQTKFAVATDTSEAEYDWQDSFNFSNYRPGHIFLSQWPFISTSLSSLFLLPLISGMTVLCDPLAAVKTENFYRSVFKFQPGQVISTGPESRRFFKMIKDSNEKRTLDFLASYIIGGDGITNEDYMEFSDVLRRRGVKDPESVLSSGYGLSECFAALTSKLSGVRIPSDKKTRLVPSVGIPFPATSIGVFDKQGVELDFCKRGEIRVNADVTKTVMGGYYENRELTLDALKRDENGTLWLYTNDIGEIGRDGQLYYYCRKEDFIETIGGVDYYSADIANYVIHGEKTLVDAAGGKNGELTFDADVKYCYAVKIDLASGGDGYAIAAHIVLRDARSNLNGVLTRINSKLGRFMPKQLIPAGYRVYENFLPEKSHKTDRKAMMASRDGFFRPSEDGLIAVNFDDLQKDNKAGFCGNSIIS